jgi:phage terminase large subunit
MKHYADPIPGRQVHESELRIDYPNGSQVRIYGADNPDRLRGLYFDGVVLDEYGLMQSRLFSEVVGPTLVDRQGWAFFIGTPNGKNQFYDVVKRAKSEPDWFFAEYRASKRACSARLPRERTRHDDAG